MNRYLPGQINVALTSDTLTILIHLYLEAPISNTPIMFPEWPTFVVSIAIKYSQNKQVQTPIIFCIDLFSGNVYRTSLQFMFVLNH